MKTLLAMIMLLVLLVACAGNTENNAGNTDADTNAAEPAQDNAAEGSAVQDPAKQDDAKDEFESLFAKRNLQWKIAYDLTSTADGKQMTSQMTQYMKGETKFRTDMAYEGMESQVYVVNEVFTMCTKNDGKWSCYKTEPSENDEAVDAREWEDDYEQNEDNYQIVADGTKVVAGVNTKCYKVVDLAETDAIVRYCFSSDGAPLYIYTKGDGYESEMIATSYTKSVSDSEFTPPAAAQDMGAMYGGAGGTSPAGGDACAYCDYLSGDDKNECLASC